MCIISSPVLGHKQKCYTISENCNVYVNFVPYQPESNEYRSFKSVNRVEGDRGYVFANTLKDNMCCLASKCRPSTIKDIYNLG